MVTVRYFAAAADAAGTVQESLQPGTLGAVIAQMTTLHGDRLGEVVGRCSLLLNGAKVVDHDVDIESGSRLDVLPPFAGGC
ncbi:MoaD/ThiS family protein [Propionibacteriaceae bacterium G1746]|uniref:MoaD/ThiS family protein n=1 Tax=Aestuariimicrobium sp. G57 TaxID=3418485 RepID=UPI003C1394A2